MNQYKKYIAGVLIIVVTLITGGIHLTLVEAASLTSLSDTLSSSKKNTVSNHDITFTTPTGIAADATVILTFESDFSVSASLDYTDIDVLDDGVNVVLAAAPSGATWGAVRTSGTVITLTNGSGAVAAGSVVRIKIGTNATSVATGDQQITNPTTADTYTISISGTFGDTGTITVPILDDDQVAVTATVAQTLTFSISDNSIEFGTLSAADDTFADNAAGNATEVEAHTIVAGTNAPGGYTITATGTTLTSGLNTIDAIGSSNTASDPGAEQFGLRMTASGGSGAVSAPYAAAGFAFDTAAFPDTVASASGASANTTYSVRYIANIASETEAGSYTSTITYAATANF
jgi:hypothetical protein